MGEVYEERRGAHTEKWDLKGECREGMQRKTKAGGGSLGAALVACLSMEHITTGFNSQRWKNHVPQAGQWRWEGLRGAGGRWEGGGRWQWLWKGVRSLLRWHACAAALQTVGLMMGEGGFHWA